MELGEDGSVYKSILVREPWDGVGVKDGVLLDYKCLRFGQPNGIECSFNFDFWFWQLFYLFLILSCKLWSSIQAEICFILMAILH